MNRWKPLPWVLVGVALLAVSLVAARLNSPPQSANGDKPLPNTDSGGSGPTVLGTVDTHLGILPLYPPGVPAMASLTVKKVLVKEGATVNPGDVLIEFDSSTMTDTKKQAEDTVIDTQWMADQARKKADSHTVELDRAKIGVKKAQEENDTAKQARDTIRDTLDKSLALKDLTLQRLLTEEEKATRRKENLDLQKAEAAVRFTEIGVENAKLLQKQAEATSALLEADVQRANVAVSRARRAVDHTTAVIESFKLKAQVAGTIELISVADGVAVGPTTRTPLMYLIPSGPRVVRAEVEAEFAYKIDAFVGKTVTVKAGEMFKDTYTGVAKRVSGAYLPKRFGSDALVGNSTRALECLIEVPDPAPVGKPPLRPGQPVRVTFGN